MEMKMGNCRWNSTVEGAYYEMWYCLYQSFITQHYTASYDISFFQMRIFSIKSIHQNIFNWLIFKIQQNHCKVLGNYYDYKILY